MNTRIVYQQLLIEVNGCILCEIVSAVTRYNRMKRIYDGEFLTDKANKTNFMIKLCFFIRKNIFNDKRNCLSV